MRLKWNTVSSSTAVMWDDAESALCCLAAHSSGHCVQRNQFCLIHLELFLFWLWALFIGRLEGSTLSIWNLAFTPSLAPFLPPLLLYSLLLHSCFLSFPPLSPLLLSRQSDSALWREQCTLFSSPHILLSASSPSTLYISSLYFAFLLPQRFHLINLIPHSVALVSSYAIPSTLSTNLLFLYFCASEALSLF